MHEAPAGAQARSLRGGDTKVNLCAGKFRLGWRWGEFFLSYCFKFHFLCAY